MTEAGGFFIKAKLGAWRQFLCQLGNELVRGAGR
jgi:hypothetical protein